jgi:hypothetical protein
MNVHLTADLPGVVSLDVRPLGSAVRGLRGVQVQLPVSTGDCRLASRPKWMAIVRGVI